MKDSHDSKHANIVCISAPFGGIGGIAPDVHPLNRQGPAQEAQCSRHLMHTNGPRRGAFFMLSRSLSCAPDKQGCCAKRLNPLKSKIVRITYSLDLKTINFDCLTMNLENFAKMRGLEAVDSSENADFLDGLLEGESGKKIKAELLTKRLQFDCHPELYAEVERVCALLSCSKRRFLEMAVLSALDKSEQIFMETFHEAHGQEFTTVYAPKGDE